jgi:hypothetical protein
MHFARTFTAFSLLSIISTLAGCVVATSAPLSAAEFELKRVEACSSKQAGDNCSICGQDPRCIETMELKSCQYESVERTGKLRCASSVTPRAYAPCATKSAGDACTICNPADRSCVETAVLKVCSATGACASASSPPPPPVYSPCAGKAQGAACTVCDPRDASCGETQELKKCTAAGQCVAQTAPPVYSPCGGKPVGAACTLCAPNEVGCVETQVLKFCDAAGTCSAKAQ